MESRKALVRKLNINLEVQEDDKCRMREENEECSDREMPFHIVHDKNVQNLEKSQV